MKFILIYKSGETVPFLMQFCDEVKTCEEEKKVRITYDADTITEVTDYDYFYIYDTSCSEDDIELVELVKQFLDELDKIWK